MTNVRFNQPGFKTLDSFFDNILSELPNVQKRSESFLPAVNISENENAYELEFNAPGRKKEDFKITFDQSILTIAFEKKEEKKEEGKKFIKTEFSTQSFKRSFTLDEKINADGIEAKYEDGILTLTLPKVEEVKVLPKEIAIS
ncbi:MAG: Hsp20/alpha crystallin family protein [Ginsengibacter sp.]|jgi:HSP20 family protein